MKKITELYKIIRKEPLLFLKRPYYLFLFPAFIFIYIRKRWKTETETIYLILTYLDGHYLLDKKLPPSNEVKMYRNFNDIKDIMLRRCEEDGMHGNYINEYQKRIKRGDCLVTLLIGNDIISYIFISEKKAYFSQLNFSEYLENECFAVYDVYTFKKYRGKGLYEILLAEVFREFKKRGYTKFWLWVMKHNKISLKVHQKLNINHVIKIYKGYYNFGFRIIKKYDADFFLSDLIENG